MTRQNRAVWMLAGPILLAAAAVAVASNEANTQPNPYRTVSDWAKLPEGRAWGSTAGVDIDSHDHIWVAERCGANSCAGSNLAPILEFDTSGKLLKSFGAGMFVFPHGIYVDKDGNVLPHGAKYDPSVAGAFTSDHPIVRAFINLGWGWGGNWTSPKDYQHFEKPLKKK